MDAATEITNFAAAQWALILLDERVSEPAGRGECARLLAQYGPAINHTHQEK